MKETTKKALKKFGIIYLVFCAVSYLVYCIDILTDKELYQSYMEFGTKYFNKIYKRSYIIAKTLVNLFS